MLYKIDDLLNRITMYRLVYWGLWVLAGWALLMSLLGQLSFSPVALVVSAGVLWCVSKASNLGFAKLFSAQANVESAAITALILFLIMLPARKPEDFFTLVLVAVLAMASKYLLAWRGKHIFNPAAIALVAMGLLGSGAALWWVASPAMLPATLAVGLAVARKLRRLMMVAVFTLVAVAVIVVVNLLNGQYSPDIWREVLVSWPVVFFGTIMLTEPSTTPPTQRWRLVYAVLVGTVFGAQLQWGPVSTTPQLALVLGNLLTLAVSAKGRLRLRLKDKVRLARNTYEYVFEPDRKLAFAAGQYLEWTLPHRHPDGRGNRRYFTVASSPTEPVVRLGVSVVPENPSSFKAALQALPVGAVVDAWQPAGDFVLPRDPAEKLVFIAGGIGITPFRSMVKHMLDAGQKRDIVLIYAAAKPDGFAYGELWAQAQRETGIRVEYVLPELGEAPAGFKGRTGYVTPQMLGDISPDFASRMFYLAGPPAMVRAYRRMLTGAGVPPRWIKTDFFAGY